MAIVSLLEDSAGGEGGSCMGLIRSSQSTALERFFLTLSIALVVELTYRNPRKDWSDQYNTIGGNNWAQVKLIVSSC